MAIVVVLIAVGYGLAELLFLPFGGIGLLGGFFVALLIVSLALGVTALLGRRRQKKAKAARATAAPDRPPRRGGR
jgi:membrane protein implicated in regulation of membrane protease activity